MVAEVGEITGSISQQAVLVGFFVSDFANFTEELRLCLCVCLRVCLSFRCQPYLRNQ